MNVSSFNVPWVSPMSSSTEEMCPYTMQEMVEYDRVRDFIDGLNQFPDSDWRVAYRYYKKVRAFSDLDPHWKLLFRLLRDHE